MIMTRLYFPDFLHKVSPLQVVRCGAVVVVVVVVVVVWCDLNKTMDITILYQWKCFSG